MARSAAGEKSREYSGEAVARVLGFIRCEGVRAVGVAGLVVVEMLSESGFKGRPAKARGAESLEKRPSKVV